MNKSIEKLTDEKLKEIYTSEEFRNQVAYAHGYSNNGETGFITCSYPVQWIVTKAQIAEAEKERLRAKKAVVKANEGKLMFVGMGCQYAARYEDDVCNHRIRTEFVNAHGKRYFIELGTGLNSSMRIDHSVDRDLEDFHDAKLAELREKLSPRRYNDPENAPIYKEMKQWEAQTYYNYKGLEHKRDLPKYTLQNVLKLVNENFDCNFKEIVVDYYNVSTDDFTSVSPKF